MATIVYEKRSFKDTNGMNIDYEYIAIKGTGTDSFDYEVQLKNLVQSEKMALRMLADKEGTYKGEVSARKADSNETPDVSRNIKADDDWLNE